MLVKNPFMHIHQSKCIFFVHQYLYRTETKDLQNMAHLSSSVIAKMGKDQPVHLDTIVKICVALQCDISDVVTLCNKEA